MLALLGLAALACGQPVQALTYVYDSTSSGSIPNVTAANCGTSGGLAVNFNVPDSFTVSSISLGLNITHPRRGEVLARLRGPGGTLQTVAQNSTDTNANYDILISATSDPTPPPLNDGDIDPVAQPYYNRLVTNTTINSLFTGNAQGVWTLYLCDVSANSNNGTFNRARLILSSTASAPLVCTSSFAYDWGSNGNNVPFTSTTVGGVAITLTTTQNFGTSDTLNGTDNFLTRNGNIGDHSGYYRLAMNALTGSQSEDIGNRVVFTFVPPVSGLTFALLDVDYEAPSGGGNENQGFEDQASVFATDSNGNPVPFSAVAAGPDVQVAGNMGEGDGDAANNDSSANVDIRFSGSVATLIIEHTQGDQPTVSAQQQAIGLSDFSICGFDYGDAPASYGTLLSDDGARHGLGARKLYLGANPPDGEAGDTNAGSDATVDDVSSVGVDDEDGVASFPTAATASGVYTVNVAVTNNSGSTAHVCGWIDFNQSGAFEAGEGVCATAPSTGAQTIPLAFTVPVADRDRTGDFVARFRTTTDSMGTSNFIGSANDGEVEDYLITGITSLPITLASVASGRTETGLWVEWTTATETRNIGFHWYGRRQGEEDWQRLTTQITPSQVIDSLDPQRYSAQFPGIAVDELLLEDWDSHGQTDRHGPFEVGHAYGFDAVAHAQPIDWTAIRAENASDKAQRTVMAKALASPDALLWVTQPGIQRIGFDALRTAGADFGGAAIAQLALTDDGQAVPRHIIDANTNGLFDSGDRLEFVGEITATLYSARNAYRLRIDPARVKAANSSALDPKNAVPGLFVDTVKFERQKAYSYTAPIDDPWYDQWLSAYGQSASLSRSFDLPGHAEGDATLNLRLWGVTDWAGSGNDHHLIVKVNGQQIEALWFDGNADASRAIALPQGLLQETGNTLVLEAPGDTGFDYDIQAFDRFDVQYQRHTQAHDGAWQGTIPNGVTDKIRVDGFQSESVAWKGNQRRVGDATLYLQGKGDWIAADARAIHTPTVQTDIPTSASTPTKGAVDYLIVSHPQFIDTPAMDDLVALQEGRGYRTAVIDVDTLYAAYSDFEVDAEAIRRYLKAARPSFVLLVGGDSHDYHDYLGLASQSFIPTHYAATDALVAYAPADGRYVDYNDNGIPQAALGRLPVRTDAEFAQLVSKLYRYVPPTRAILAAGPSDSGRQFAPVSEGYAAQLPSGLFTQAFHVDDLGLSDAKTALTNALNLDDGALVSYVGHSSYRIWGLNPKSGILFWADDARALHNATPHIVTQWGCWNTYFVNPKQDTMAHGFLFQDEGAAAVLGATALTDLNLLRGFGNAFFGQFGRRATLGEALREAQQRHVNANPDAARALRGFALLGDPAAELH